MSEARPKRVILHIPHASRAIPDEVRAALTISSAELEREQDRLVDHYTDELFDAAAAAFAKLVFPVSRFAIDVERFEDDASEPMAARGMGVIYTHATGSERFRTTPTAAERERLLARYYRPHHERLEQLVADALTTHGEATVVDCHSFPDRPLPCDQDRSGGRPDICIGTDDHHTPTALIEKVETRCRHLGWTVARDRPYAGTIVPVRFFGNEPKVRSIMIEVNRRLYLRNEPWDVRRHPSGWETTRAGLQSILEDIREWRA